MDIPVLLESEASFHMQLDRLLVADSTEPRRPPGSGRPNLQVVVLVECHCMNLIEGNRKNSQVWPDETLILSEVEAVQLKSGPLELLAIVTLERTDTGTVGPVAGIGVPAAGTAPAT